MVSTTLRDPSTGQPHFNPEEEPKRTGAVSEHNDLLPWPGSSERSAVPFGGAAKPTCPCEPRLLAEERLSHSMEELARSNRDLEQFAFVASHDLQEPLRIVAAYTQLLSEKYHGRLDADADRYIRYATEGALRMQTLIEGLLIFSRVGGAEAPGEQVASLLALEEALRNLSHAVAESGAVTHCGCRWCGAERTQLTQVFQNLLANAIKFRRKEPPIISVQAEAAGADWLFSVSDNGIGIEPEYAAIVFGLFRRLHTQSEYEGSGIGLAICQRIVERFGGRIWVESRAGEGSTFKFTLPRVSGDSQSGAQS